MINLMNYGIIETESLKKESILSDFNVLKSQLIKPIESTNNGVWHTNLLLIDDESIINTIQTIEKNMKDGWFGAVFNQKYYFLIFRNKTFELSVVKDVESNVYKEAQKYATEHGVQAIYINFYDNLMEYISFISE